MITEPLRYDVYLDYKGYQIEPRSYRVFPAPLMGSRFSTGRTAYSNLDFWQIGALTDFTKGINQKFLVDPSRYFLSEGIDVSKEGELRLERDLESQSFPSSVGYVTARYRAVDTLFLGTSTGKVLKSVDGLKFDVDKDTGAGKIYGFYEMKGNLYVTKGTADHVWRRSPAGQWLELDWGDLFFVMVESDYAYGVFDDGVRQSVDGETWVPAPPDPLWELPSSEGVALNAIPIQRGFLIGAKRGLWIFIGGGSAVNIWLFPEFASANNFRGMAKFGIYGVFSVENQGIFYTDGAGVYPTNLNWREDGIKILNSKSILTSGWDMFALVSDGTDWYLARCNMVNVRVPKYWWLVKKLSKEPAYLSTFSRDKVFIHYVDGTCQKYNKISGSYQSSGYLISPLIDENLVLLQKLYNSISALLSAFPTKTKVKLGYRLKDSGDFTSKSFSGSGTALEKSFNLANPTLSTRIQIKLELETTDAQSSPVLTDLCWKYILERPVDEVDRKKNFNFTILGEDELEKRDSEKLELGERTVRTREEIVDDIWETRNKKEVLNFVGADNVPHKALVLRYTGAGSSCQIKIDRTNYKLTTKVDGAADLEKVYKDMKILDLVSWLNSQSGYNCSGDPGLPQDQLANDLMPVEEVEVKGKVDIYYGTDVHAVIFSPNSPGQFKGLLEGRGSDRLVISLREA